MVKTTFPHFGNFYLPFRAFLSEIGLDPVVPPLTSQQTIARGTKVAPEFACFPLKINLGNFLEGIESGAECILMAGGSGPCRFGYYGTLQQEILRDAGIGAEIILLEPPQTGFPDLWNRLKRLIPRRGWRHLLPAFFLFWMKAEALDRFDREANQVRPLEKTTGEVTCLQRKYYQALDRAGTLRETKMVLRENLDKLRAIPIASPEEVRPLQLVLLGEIFMVLENRANFEIERKLGEMGVEVNRTIYLTDWIREHFWPGISKRGWFREIQHLAQPYLTHPVGGHGLETVAHTVAAGKNRQDGVVHLAPFTCMPEAVAMQTFPVVTRETDLPVLTFLIDEHAAEAGIQTRLEAFIDLLKYRRDKAGRRG